MRYEDRLESIDRDLAELRSRLERLEGGAAAERVQPSVRPAVPPKGPAQTPRSTIDLEALLGGRVLAWVGGAAVVLGVVFFLAMAVKNGWIDEPTRVSLAFLGSTALFCAGLYLYERRGQTDAAVAAVAAGIAALYASLVAATQLYDLLAPALGLAVAALVGGAATAIAVRWRSALVGSLGIIGALASPVLVGAGTSGVSLAFMAVALASAVAVLLWQRWDWLAAAAYLVSVPQLLVWLEDSYREDVGLALGVLLLLWALYVVAAVGHEVRVPTEALRASSAMLLLGNAILTAGTGWYVLDRTDHASAAVTWVIALALAHVALGAVAFRSRVSREIASLLVAVGVGLSAVGLALALSGPALVVGWAVEAAVLAWVGRRTGDARAQVAVGAFLALAGAHILLFEAPPESLREGVDDLPRALVALLVAAAAALFAARRHEGEPAEWRLALEAAGAIALVYAGSIAVVDVATGTQPVDSLELRQTPQVLLSAFWSIVGVAALVYGLVRDDRRYRTAGLTLLGVAAFKVFFYDLAQLGSIYRVLSFIALGLLLLAAAFAYQRIRLGVREQQ